MGRNALEVWLVVAGAAHVVLVVAASRLPLPVAQPYASAEPVEIALAEDEPVAVASVPSDEPGASAPAMAVARGGVAAVAAVAEATGAAPAVVATEPGTWSFSTTAPVDVLAARPLVGPVTPEPAPAPSAARPPSRTGGLVEGLDARDREVGLGHGGPVLSAVEEAARVPGESAPEGHATFEVTVHRSGSVNVSVRNATDGTWESLREAIVRGVAAKRVTLPTSASGMRFVIAIDARVQWPDGKRSADVGTKPLLSMGPGSKTPNQPGLSFQNVPMVGVVHQGKVCSVGGAVYPGFVAIGGGCSPENIGQPAARIVHGRIESEARL